MTKVEEAKNEIVLGISVLLTGLCKWPFLLAEEEAREEADNLISAVEERMKETIRLSARGVYTDVFVDEFREIVDYRIDIKERNVYIIPASVLAPTKEVSP